MRIHLATIAYNSGDGVADWITTAISAQHELRYQIFLHSAHPPTVAACRKLVSRADVQSEEYMVNRGVSRSWNDAILDGYGSGADLVVLSNDDIRFGPGDLDDLVAYAAAHPEAFMVGCAGPDLRADEHKDSHDFACFVLNPVALDVIGCFDENITPAYEEDHDYNRRAILAGLPAESCPGTRVVHHGSGTIYRDAGLFEENKATHWENWTYYQRKWGGPWENEMFASPFNSSEFGVRIAPEARHRPYGDFDRAHLRRKTAC
jgi:GT2 family glycosyltransferase